MRLYALIFALAACRVSALPLDSETAQVAQPADTQPDPETEVEKFRNVPDVIPVAIVEDTIPSLKIDENSNDYIPSEDEPTPLIKRLEIDLNNPGPPQRQQHDTQNPESYSERDSFVADIKQKLLDTEIVFRKSVSNVKEAFENWVPTSGHLRSVQNDIKDMQNKFLAQLDNLHQSLQGYLNPQSAKAVITDPEATASLKEVENRLKILQDNFKAGVQTLSVGVGVLEAKADGDAGTAEKPTGTDPANPTPTNPTNGQTSNNPFGQVIQFFSDTVGQAITQMQNTFNAITNPSNQNNAAGSNTSSQPSWNPLPGIFNSQSSTAPPAGAQSDEAATRPPSFLENLQAQVSQIFNNVPNPWPQANQILQNFINQVRPSSATPTDANTNTHPENDPVAQDTAPIPAKPVKNQASAQPAPVTSVQPQAQPVNSQAPEPAKDSQATPQPGPIRQIVQNNPIVKGIVQRIQSISNPEKPRGEKPEKASEPEKAEIAPEPEKPQTASEPAKSGEPIKEEPVPVTKGHGGNGNSGANSDGINVKTSPVEEKKVPLKCEMEKEKEVVNDKEEKETALLPDKTE